MARKFLTALDMGKNQFITPVIENLSGAPSSPVKGQLYFNTTDNILYWYNGSGWVQSQGGAGAVPATTVTSLAIGDSAVVGVATTYAREDHKHGAPGFGAATATTTFGLSKADGVGTTVARSDHGHGTPVHDATAHSAIPHSALAAPTADVPWGGFKITNLGPPTVGTDATTKTYVDNLTAGLSWKDAVRVASIANGVISTAFANGQTVDGVVLATGDRILVKSQSSGAENGIYIVAASGTPTRASDADAVGELEQATVFVQEGTTLADTAWTCTTNGAITPGVTSTAWAQFGAGTAYQAGNALTLTASTFDVVPLDASIVVAADSIRAGYAGPGTAVTLARSDHNHDTGATAVYTRKYSIATIGGSTSQVITHNLNTKDVTVEVYRNASPFDTVECDIQRTTVNTITLLFAVAPAANEYSCVVVG